MPCDKSKNVEPVHSFSPFQNGRPFSVKADNTGGRLDVQTGSERCILQCPIRSKLEKVRKVSVEGDSLRVHMPVFWTRSSTKSVYKVIENSNLSPEKDQYQSDDIFGRYVGFESHNTRSSHKQRHCHISPAEFGLYNKYEEINFAPMPENRISGNGDRFNQNDFIIDTREGKKVVKTCQNLLRSHSTTLLELTRVVDLLSSAIEAVEPAKIQLRFLQQQQIVCLRKKMSYQSVPTLNTKSITENKEQKNKNMIRLSKKIWYYLLNHNMAITAEYLPSVLNTLADRE